MDHERQGRRPDRDRQRELQQAVFSPDGSRIAAVGGGQIHVMDTLGGSRTPLALNGAAPDPGTLAWQTSAPPLVAGLQSLAVEGTDLFDVKLTVSNAGADPLTSLTFPSGTGIVKDGTLGLQPIFAPQPGYPAALAAASSSEHVVGFEVTSPGSALLLTRVKATDKLGTVHQADAAVRIEASERDMTEQDYDAAVTGGLAVLLDQVARQREAAIKRLTDSVRKQLQNAGAKKNRGLLKADKQERALAHQHNLPVDTFALLQRHASNRFSQEQPGYKELAMIFAIEGTQNFVDKVGATLDKATKKSITEPAAFWRDFVFNSKDGDWAKVGHELSAMTREGVIKGGGYLGEAGKFWTNPAAAKSELWREIPKVVDETKAAIAAGIDDAAIRTLKWDKLMDDNPRAGMKQFAIFFSNLEAAVVSNAIEELFDPIERAKALNEFRKAQKAAGKADDALDVAPLTRRAANADVHGGAPGSKVPGVPGARVLAKNGDVATGPIPGLGNMTPQQLDFISGELDRLNKKFGVDIELQVRPVNAYSAQIKGGIGKVEAIPTKNLTPDDLLLGAPEEWLGQPAYYKPVKPTGTRQEAICGPSEDRAALRGETAGVQAVQGPGQGPHRQGRQGEEAAEARRRRGQLGTAYKGKIELKQTTKDGATLIEYKQLEVNGRPVFNPKDGPRPIVSDFDINAAIDSSTGRNLPAGIRAQVELGAHELLLEGPARRADPLRLPRVDALGVRLREELQPLRGLRPQWFRLQELQQAHAHVRDEEQALKFARRWAPKFFPELGKIADPRKLSGSTARRWTRSSAAMSAASTSCRSPPPKAVFGPGIDPSLGSRSPSRATARIQGARAC